VAFAVLWLLIALVQPDAPAEEESATLQLGLPGRDWLVEFEAPGVEFGDPETGPSRVWTSGDDLETAFTIFALIEKAPDAIATVDCQENLDPRLARAAWNPKGARHWDQNGMAITEYHLEDYRGQRIDQRNVAAYRFHDGCCVAVKLTGEQFRDADRPRFDAILNSIRIVDAAALDQPPLGPEAGRK
jgi:hypothetical protein